MRTTGWKIYRVGPGVRETVPSQPAVFSNGSLQKLYVSLSLSLSCFPPPPRALSGTPFRHATAWKPLSAPLPFMNLWEFIANLGIGDVSFCFDNFGVPSAGNTRRRPQINGVLLYARSGSLIRRISAGSWGFRIQRLTLWKRNSFLGVHRECIVNISVRLPGVYALLLWEWLEK